MKWAVRSRLPLAAVTSSQEPDREVELVGAMTLLKKAVRSWLPLETVTCRACRQNLIGVGVGSSRGSVIRTERAALSGPKGRHYQ